ncbi:MAG TPA: hypothetical protein VOA41_19015 [Candidatus Dormibacteraeota bacterium]|nr:hypothetical protein [Candidatus Dormibacteraeota bacterium]
MIAALIFVLSLVALLQFFVFYCRSMIATSRKQMLSLQARDVTGISEAAARGDEFDRILELVQLCPELRTDRNDIRAVHLYYGLLSFLRATVAQLLPDLNAWTERERGGCAYFAAVALDRRIAFSRNLMAEQMPENL